ncbi:hypothetical protein G6F59_018189 [Rhizopus arrhizus]|nr:hypothetical protein G6F59_018189 [Rhizopus arrhizus]
MLKSGEKRTMTGEAMLTGDPDTGYFPDAYNLRSLTSVLPQCRPRSAPTRALRAQQQPQVLAHLALIDHAQAALLVHRIDAEAGQQRAAAVTQQRGRQVQQ